MPSNMKQKWYVSGTEQNPNADPGFERMGQSINAPGPFDSAFEAFQWCKNRLDANAVNGLWTRFAINELTVSVIPPAPD